MSDIRVASTDSGSSVEMTRTGAVEYVTLADTDGPRRIAEEITSALSAVPCVRAIALFGSLAEGCADAWSDVDMLVACDDVDAAKWDAATALRGAKQVLFYRPFTTAQQPSGRYWLAGESPFQRIDISFDSVEEYSALLQGGGRLGHEITAREVYRRSGASTRAMGAVSPCLLAIGDREREIGNYVYQSLRSLQRLLRGGEDARGFEGLQAAAAELPPDAVMAGGRIGELVHSVAGMIEHVLHASSSGMIDVQ